MSCRFVILHVIDNHDKNSFIIKNGETLFEIIHDASKNKKRTETIRRKEV